MTTRTKIIIAALSTLIIISGAISLLNLFSNFKSGTLGVNSDVSNLIMQREAGYTQLINEANRTIADLNAQLAGTEINANYPVEENILPIDQILLIAQANFGSELQPISSPELVDYSGTIAYEIRYDQGNLYIDAITGEVISSQLPKFINEEQAIESAADYLGILDTKNMTVKKSILDSQEVFVVYINNYVVFVDKTGNVLRLQVIQYASSQNSSSSQSSNDSHEEHDEDDD